MPNSSSSSSSRSNLSARVFTCSFEHRENVLLGCQFPKNRWFLRQVTEAQARPQIHRQLRHVLAIQEILPFSERSSPTSIKTSSSFRTVRSEKSDDFALFHATRTSSTTLRRPYVFCKFSQKGGFVWVSGRWPLPDSVGDWFAVT